MHISQARLPVVGIGSFAVGLVLVGIVPPGLCAAPQAVNYHRDVRPILSQHCYRCHGPDAAKRRAKLRLDTKEGAFAELRSGGLAIVPGDSSKSELVRRISVEDPEERMPPPEAGSTLTPAQVELIRRWIDSGAEWKGHWSFTKPELPALPAVRDSSWPRSAADRFILARLEREGFSPALEADSSTLLRRAALDLTGLPPALDEVDELAAADAPDAYDRAVDRLLSSLRYGEHRARYWLDAARYGDTHGLHLDNERSIWPYREWVIDAFNAGMPFDQFTVEQLAGDLLPAATLAQRVATGFNRCNVSTSEGGAIDEEFRVRYAVDRVETTSMVWMGLTAGCAACHDHKYDPITQKDFYGLFAFFNSLTENAMDGNISTPPPVLPVPMADQEAELAVLRRRIDEAQAQLEAPIPAVDEAQARWEEDWTRRTAEDWQVLALDALRSEGGTALQKLDDGSVLAGGPNPDKEVYEVEATTERTGILSLRLEALRHESFALGGAGRASNANFVLSEVEVTATSLAGPVRTEAVAFASALANYSQKDYEVAKAIDGQAGTGWAVDGPTRPENRTAILVAQKPFGFEGGTRLRIRLVHAHGGQHAIGRFRLAVSSSGALAPVVASPWLVVGPFHSADGAQAFATDFGPEAENEPAKIYDGGKLSWKARPDFTDGAPHALEGESCATYLHRVIHAPTARKATLALGSDDALKVWLNGKLVLERNVQRAVASDQEQISVDLVAGSNRLLLKVVNYFGGYAFYFRMSEDAAGEELLQLASLFSTPPAQRSAAQRKALRDHYRSRHSPEWKALREGLAPLRKEEDERRSQLPRTLVMQDMAEKRDAYVLVRGAYDRRGDKVAPGVPAALTPLPASVPQDRLGLARWLVDPAHPLTARVASNRLWQQLFGIGIVRTSEDFGAQGEWPVHPELLDWLATELVRSNWDYKRFVRLLATSAAYRQSSRATPQLIERDPENRLLGRGPRFRLDAEVLRDNALALSGLLVHRLGGPSVKPYQPPGLWEAVGFVGSNTQSFKQDQGEALYRRSLYTFWKRTSPPPTLSIFDAPTRESCTVSRPRTNTPSQALALMNDVQFVEAARRLAQRMMHEGGAEAGERAAYGFRLATARRPAERELAALFGVYGEALADYRRDKDAAVAFLSLGESKRDESLDPAELAAWTLVANLILNLDETVTKG
jgi:hypothetical protein